MTSAFVEETQIPNGPLVVSHAMPDAQSVAIGFFVDTGSRDEDEGQAGIAHALEHMLFKGTQTLDVHALSERLDQLGGHANAFTSRERTCFHIHVLHEDWQEALSLLTEMMLKPRLPEEEWLREREVIFSEMSMVDDTPDEWVYDQHMHALFPGQSLGRPTLGTKDALKALSHHDLRVYLEQNYRPPRLLVAASGHLDHQLLVDMLTDITWPLAEGGRVRDKAVMQPQVQLLERSFEQVQLVASFPGINSASSQRPVAWLANQMLGGSMSSHLFREVREKRGLAYSIGSHLSTLSDTGVWSISGGTDPSLLPECLHVIRDTIDAFASSICEASLERAKRQMEVQFRMGMESVEGHMLYLGGRLDEEILLSHTQWVEKIRAVQPDEIRAWAGEKLAAKPMWSICASEHVLQTVENVGFADV
ncbi:MAG: insulinase family protein [Mariprofundaceae bacterium]|nr:insulinase family protein [Mariprofundaceae bacterium]